MPMASSGRPSRSRDGKRRRASTPPWPGVHSTTDDRATPPRRVPHTHVLDLRRPWRRRALHGVCPAQAGGSDARGHVPPRDHAPTRGHAPARRRARRSPAAQPRAARLLLSRPLLLLAPRFQRADGARHRCRPRGDGTSQPRPNPGHTPSACPAIRPPVGQRPTLPDDLARQHPSTGGHVRAGRTMAPARGSRPR